MSQLRLEKDDLDNVPDIPLPEGYAIRTYRPGDEVGIARIYGACSLGEGTIDQVQQGILSAPCFKPERVFVAEHVSELVGTAAAWIDASCNDPSAGYLHMVGVLPEHRGKRLGAILTIAALRYSRSEGFTRQQIATDDWREAALRTYLDLGYYPLIRDDTHIARWAVVSDKLARPEIYARMKRA
jgi:GNAT superfamily N-acetyltransferase